MKALPFTMGHKFLIDTALKHSEKVCVIVGSIVAEPIPGEIRFTWVKECYKNNKRVMVRHCSEELPQKPEEHPDFWAIWVDVVKRYCPSDLDVIFSSELYGEPYAKHLGIKHHLVDLNRTTVPVSGTKARTNPFKFWKYIPNNVKPYFVKKVAILGPESVGKSTLCTILARHYKTNYVPEYGRTLCEMFDNNLDLDDFFSIAKVQLMLEDAKTNFANKLLFCDTELLTTYVFGKIYFPDHYLKMEPFFNKNIRAYHLVFLLKPDCPAVQDGTREHLELREKHYEMIRTELVLRNIEFVEISGSWAERKRKSIRAVKKLLDAENGIELKYGLV